MFTDTELVEKLVAEFNEILSLPQNAEAKKNWLEVTKDLKPAECDTRESWASGREITIDCKFTSGEKNDIFRIIASGLQDKNGVLHFIYGLNPKEFHFNKYSVIKKDDVFFLRFILRK